MLTRRKLLTHGLPTALTTAGVCVQVEANAEPTTDELLTWAKDHEYFIMVYKDGSASCSAIVGKTWSTPVMCGDTLREALLRARAEIEKGASDGTP